MVAAWMGNKTLELTERARYDLDAVRVRLLDQKKMNANYLPGCFAALPLVVPLYWAIRSLQGRALFLLTLSVLGVSLLSPYHALYFLLNIVLVYYAGSRLQQGCKARKACLVVSIAWLVSNLCVLKYGGALAAPRLLGLQRIVLPLGMSYVVFRLIHYLVESYRNNVPQASLCEFASYVLFLPSFLAGPVERFQRFQSQATAQTQPNLKDVNSGLLRIALGIIRKFVIADNLARYAMPVLLAPEQHSRLVVILCVYSIIIRIYMDFAGYTDIAIGVARLFGFRLSENFNKPLLQPNIALFWRNWHITVYTWIRDYFFFPFFGFRASKPKLYAGIFASITLFMLWHEASWEYLMVGLYHGMGLTAWSLLQSCKRRYAVLRRVMAHPLARWASVFVTFTFVSCGAAVYTCGFHGMAEIAGRIWGGG